MEAKETNGLDLGLDFQAEAESLDSGSDRQIEIMEAEM